MKARLKDSFGLPDVEVIGQPTEVNGACQLLVGAGLEGQYQFQWWALDLIGAQPQGGTQKKGADQYTYVWKTDASWSGTCRLLALARGHEKVPTSGQQEVPTPRLT